MVQINVEYKESTIISRETNFNYRVQCIFDRRLNISSANVVNVVDKIQQFEVSSTTNFTATMKMYERALFINVATPPVQVGPLCSQMF